jgi:hypothetical protein
MPSKTAIVLTEHTHTHTHTHTRRPACTGSVMPRRGPILASFVVLPGGRLLTNKSLVMRASKELQPPYPWPSTPCGSAFSSIQIPPLFADPSLIE